MGTPSKPYSIVATCAGGLEPVLESEVRALAAGTSAAPEYQATEPGIVRFRGAAETVVAANRGLRTASRILVSLIHGAAVSYDDLYALASRVPWERHIAPEATFAVTALARSQTLSNHKFLAMRVKDAIVDRQREKRGRRSNIDRRGPDYPVVVHASDDGVEISLDTSGRSLHERGYRREAGEAPLRESLAAGLVLLSDWDGTVPLFDPFCGSGTIVIEAALIQAGRVPGDLGRRYAFERWPEFRGVTAPEAEATKKGSGRIIAADRDPSVLAVAKRNAERAGVDHLIRFVPGAFEELALHDVLGPGAAATPAMPDDPTQSGPGSGHGGGPTGVIVTNPPYGERMPELDVATLYQMIGDNLKARYAGWSAWIITANLQAAKRIGLRSSSKTVLYNGALETRLYEFRVY
ncbi:MAG: THUMP domain-containing class I SAM-dependent RNA methyltransferase [Spirochaetota bacterium]